MSDEEMNRLSEVAANYEKYPLYIDEEASVTFDRMMRSIRKMVTEYGVRVIFVDYIQIVRISKRFENESQKLAFISRELKNIAKELHIVVVALSQLNRSGVKEGVVSKSSLRNSGELEEASDTILLIDRPDADLNTKGKKFEGDFSWVANTENKAVFKIDKGRSTGCAEYLVDFIPEYTMFLDNAEAGYDITYSGIAEENQSQEGDHFDDGLPF
jgi:replicative DNA helicase